ncbi:MAG: nitrate transporter substrate-binding protein, partial [Rhizobacter sp.]|nr:nitrate transporter substrate-binding protein [Rhizobacter sp.]
MKASPHLQRRQLLQAALGASGFAFGGLLSIDAMAQAKARLKMQLGWLAGGNQVG